jgi:DNA ligase (NAD+)
VDIVVSKETMEDDIDIKIKQITHFFKTLKIKHLSEKTIKKFVEEGYENEFEILKADREKMAEIEGLGEKSITKIFEGIDERMQHLELETLMDASGVFGRLLGTTKLKLITDKYPDISSLKKFADDMYEKVLEIDGFGDKLAENVATRIKDFLKYFGKISKIYDLEYLVDKPKVRKTKKNKNSLLDGKTIVFTGFRDAELQKKIEDNGGKVTTSVSGKTDMVICADDAEPTGKIQKAIEKGIKVVSKTDFSKEYF